MPPLPLAMSQDHHMAIVKCEIVKCLTMAHHTHKLNLKPFFVLPEEYSVEFRHCCNVRAENKLLSS